jgi:hypothetical protein
MTSKTDVLKFLIDVHPAAARVADTNAQQTPLHYAMRCDASAASVRLLLKCWHDAGIATDRNGFNPLAVGMSCTMLGV